MKIRQGFISNSSSSSFVIMIHQQWFPKLQLLSENEKINKLTKWGFYFSENMDPFIDYNSVTKNKKGDITSLTKDINKGKIDSLCLRFFVACNQDSLISLLVSNNIPFMASIHYGDYLCVYERNSKWVYQFANYGSTFNQFKSLPQNIKDINNEPKFIKTSKKDILKNYNEKEIIKEIFH